MEQHTTAHHSPTATIEQKLKTPSNLHIALSIPPHLQHPAGERLRVELPHGREPAVTANAPLRLEL